MALYHISDLHIKDARRSDLQVAMCHTYKLIEVDPCPLKYVVITGDIFHRKSNLSPNNVRDLLAFVYELSKRVKLVIVIPGEHDICEDMNNLALFNDPQLNKPMNVMYVLNTSVCSFDNIIFHMIVEEDMPRTPDGAIIVPGDTCSPTPLPDGSAPNSSLPSGGPLRVVVMHEALTDFTPHSCRFGVKDFRGFDIVCNGYYHDHKILPQQRISFAGALLQQNIGETIEKGFIRWNLATKEALFVAIPASKIYTAFYALPDGSIGVNGGIQPPTALTLADFAKLPTPLKVTVTGKPSDQMRTQIELYATSTPVEYITEDEHDFAKNLQTIAGQCVEIRTLLASKHIDAKVIDRVVELHSKKLQTAPTISHSDWSLTKLEWEGFMCYPTYNCIDFSKINGNICGIIAPNKRGKSTIVDALSYAMYGVPLRGTARDLVNTNSNSMYVKVTWTEHLGDVTTPAPAAPVPPSPPCPIGILACVVPPQAPVAPLINTYTVKRSKTGSKAENVVCTKNGIPIDVLPGICSREELLASVILTQQRDGDFLNMPGRDQKALLSKIFGTNLMDEFLGDVGTVRKELTARHQANTSILKSLVPGSVDPVIHLIKLEKELAAIDAATTTSSGALDMLRDLEKNITVPPTPPSDAQLHKYEQALSMTTRMSSNDIRKKIDEAHASFDTAVSIPHGPLPSLRTLQDTVAKLTVSLKESSDWSAFKPKHDSLQYMLSDCRQRLNALDLQIMTLEKRSSELDKQNDFKGARDSTIRLAKITSELGEINKQYDPLIKQIQNPHIIASLRPAMMLERTVLQLRRDIANLGPATYKNAATIREKLGAGSAEAMRISIDVANKKIADCVGVPTLVVKKMQFTDACASCRHNKTSIIDNSLLDALYTQITNAKARLREIDDLNSELAATMKRDELTDHLKTADAQLSGILLKTACPAQSVIKLPHTSLADLDADFEILEYVEKNASKIESNTKLGQRACTLRDEIQSLSKLATMAKEYSDVTAQMTVSKEERKALIIKLASLETEQKALPILASAQGCPPRPVWQIESELKEAERVFTNYDKIKKNIDTIQYIAALRLQLSDCLDDLPYGDDLKKLYDAGILAKRLHAEYQEKCIHLEHLREDVRHNDEEVIARKKRAAEIKGDCTMIRAAMDACNVISLDLQAYEAYQLSLDYKTGLPCLMLQQIVSTLELRTNAVLKELADFIAHMLVRFTDRGCTIIVEVGAGSAFVPAEMASGYQQFVLSIAIRQAIVQLAGHRLPKFLIIDEGFGCLDQRNMSRACEYLPTIKRFFEFVMIISHVTQTQCAVEVPIYIRYKDVVDGGNLTAEDYGDVNPTAIPEGSFIVPDGTMCDTRFTRNVNETAKFVGKTFCKVCEFSYNGSDGPARTRHEKTKKHHDNLMSSLTKSGGLTASFSTSLRSVERS